MTTFFPKKEYDRQTFSATYSSTLDLDRRMKDYAQRHRPFNWSAYIRDCIERKLSKEELK